MTTPKFTGTGALTARVTIGGIGPQHPRAANSLDERGELVFAFLPPALDDAENSTAAADYDRWRLRPRVFQRPATVTEVLLLQHLGHAMPVEPLVTEVKFRTRGVRNRRWPQIEAQEATP
jgi:hypothetical protein